ncbi:MAG: tetratricopeptide repeat protein [Candidatus Kapabacteria bacterium]|nr:tetratricopeptide repeat protein [Candidatus Kapabacteria bacterium]
MNAEDISRAKQADELMDKGQDLMQRGQHAEAMPLVLEALAIAENIGHRNHCGRARNLLGIMATFLGDSLSAFEHLRHALDLAIELDQHLRVASTLHNIGMILDNTGNYP